MIVEGAERTFASNSTEMSRTHSDKDQYIFHIANSKNNRKNLKQSNIIEIYI